MENKSSLSPVTVVFLLAVGMTIAIVFIVHLSVKKPLPKENTERDTTWANVDTIQLDSDWNYKPSIPNETVIFDDTMSVMKNDSMQYIRFKISSSNEPPRATIYLQGRNVKEVHRRIKKVD